MNKTQSDGPEGPTEDSPEGEKVASYPLALLITYYKNSQCSKHFITCTVLLQKIKSGIH